MIRETLQAAMEQSARIQEAEGSSSLEASRTAEMLHGVREMADILVIRLEEIRRQMKDFEPARRPDLEEMLYEMRKSVEGLALFPSYINDPFAFACMI